MNKELLVVEELAWEHFYIPVWELVLESMDTILVSWMYTIFGVG